MLIHARTAIHKKQTGFTLVEIAVVLVIVGLLVGSFIGTFADRIDSTRRDNTQKELEEIKQVLMAYAYSRTPPYLPCPDTDVPPDGLENRVGANCTAAGATGVFPWREVGIGNEDAWGARYGYWVSSDYNNTSGFLLTSTDNGGVNSAIQTRVGNANANIVQNAVAVVFSHGKNGLGGISSDGVNRPPVPAVGNGHDDENENIDNDLNFISRSPSEEGSVAVGGVYDDILVWISSYEIKAKMVEAGALP